MVNEFGICCSLNYFRCPIAFGLIDVTEMFVVKLASLTGIGIIVSDERTNWSCRTRTAGKLTSVTDVDPIDRLLTST